MLNYENFIKENLNDDSIKLAYILTSIFSNIDPQKYNIDFFSNYVKTIPQSNNQFVNNALKDFKKKISSDYRILNKQELISKVDTTPILTRKNDEVFARLYAYAKKQSNHNDPSSFTITMENDNSIIFLSKEANYNEIMHELFHLVKDDVINKTVKNVFNFNYNIQQQNQLFSKLTNGEFKITRSNFDKQYLSDPKEIYPRLNNLKMFLFQHNYLSNPNMDIPVETIGKLFNGEFYSSLDDKSKEEFRNSDFIDILVFLDLNKFGLKQQINEGNLLRGSIPKSSNLTEQEVELLEKKFKDFNLTDWEYKIHSNYIQFRRKNKEYYGDFPPYLLKDTVYNMETKKMDRILYKFYKSGLGDVDYITDNYEDALNYVINILVLDDFEVFEETNEGNIIKAVEMNKNEKLVKDVFDKIKRNIIGHRVKSRINKDGYGWIYYVHRKGEEKTKLWVEKLGHDWFTIRINDKYKECSDDLGKEIFNFLKKYLVK